MKIQRKLVGFGVAVLTVVVSGASAYAALTDSTNLSQQIGAGTLSGFIGDSTGNVVASPSVTFTSKSVSNQTQTSTGTFGSSSQRIYVDNPGAVTGSNGWTVTLAATDGPTAAWTSGSNTYAFNGSTADDGQLTVDPSTGTVTAEVGGTTGITLGSSSTFSGGTNTPVTLMNAASTADDINRVYLTGVSFSQTIPASTPAGTYTLDFTQTLAQV